jgi:hypothetical protein
MAFLSHSIPGFVALLMGAACAAAYAATAPVIGPTDRTLLFQLGHRDPLAVDEWVVNPDGLQSRSFANGGSEGTATAMAQTGIVRTTARAKVGASAYANVRGGGSYRDAITPESDGRDGQPGVMSIRLLYESQLLTQGHMLRADAYNRFSFGFNSNGSFDAFTGWSFGGVDEIWSATDCDAALGCVPTYQGRARFRAGDTGPVRSIAEFDEFVIDVPVVFGRPVAFYMQMESTVLATGGLGGAEWLLDAGRSMYWAGVTGMTDSGGIPVDYSLRSLTGTDYRTDFSQPGGGAVPEPPGWALLAVAVAAALRARAVRCARHAV